MEEVFDRNQYGLQWQQYWVRAGRIVQQYQSYILDFDVLIKDCVRAFAQAVQDLLLILNCDAPQVLNLPQGFGVLLLDYKTVWCFQAFAGSSKKGLQNVGIRVLRLRLNWECVEAVDLTAAKVK